VNWLHGLRQTNWPQAHGKPNDQFTLPENMQQVLDQHAQRPNQPVPSTITQTNIDHASTDGPVQMNHQTQFHYQPGQDPNRYEYLRFAKASRYTGGNASTTVPGYLSYGPAQRLDPGARPITEAGVNTQGEGKVVGVQHS
jgi:hypothetical protein